VDRHDAGVFQPRGDLGLEEEAALAGGVVRVPQVHPLDRDRAVQVGVGGAKHLAEATLA